jgi:hypothetical protein|uniref:Uncharacterized protein n=1 Tax=Fadolivirus 2 TaxID=2740747 RepID=A0A7D3UU55_9VIRU|nr:hypothetical protein Fadolivirus_2_4 [Fadolivirus 2]
MLSALGAEGIAGIVGISSLLGLSAVYSYGTRFEKRITIDDKFERIIGNQNSTKQVFSISDKENNIYKVVPSFWYWKWYSTETWNNFKKGETYDIKGYGVRYGPLSIYPNIISAEQVINDNK